MPLGLMIIYGRDDGDNVITFFNHHEYYHQWHPIPPFVKSEVIVSKLHLSWSEDNFVGV